MKLENLISKYSINGGIKSFIIAVLSTILISYFHFTTHEGHNVIHFVHYYFFYLVIVYVALKFGFLGGLISSFVLSLIYNARVYLIFSTDGELLRPQIEVAMMYTLGIFSGVISQKLHQEKDKLVKVSEKLKESLTLLEESSKEKVRLEKEFAKADRLKTIGQLTAGIAHEIRNPLAAIKSGIGIVKKGKFDVRVLELVSSEIDRLNGLIERFLQFARSGKSVEEEFYLKKILEEVCELASLTYKNKKNISFSCDLNVKQDIVISGDKNLVKQAVFNVVLNAIEAVEHSVDKGLISLVSYNDAENAYIEIRDNGAGIPEKDLDNVFEPFFSSKDTGTGLGLTIAVKSIREHNGDIFVRNDNGAVFTIKIPLMNRG